ncbi:MAG: magnesium chelatase subunit D family protein [Propionibacteriaceae bacterium]|nr:magnesium chelatase subunit D family protein [Propionibacteriaceae bacterium]
MSSFPFAAVVGSDDMALALLLTTVSPEVGGVLVRGEKGTAKSTMVRALTELLPEQRIVTGCRFGCDPAAGDPGCPDGPHTDAEVGVRAARLVELPVGATEDRVTGSLDLEQALGAGVARFSPGLLAEANRGILYVDEVNLLHDHLVDLLLDAAAMGRSTVERDGISVSHAARIVLVGTMNPEEGELRPQLLDRFGLTVEVTAPRDPQLRAEVVRRRLAFDADPDAFTRRFAAEQTALAQQIRAARALVPKVELDDWALGKIATVCAGFEVDGMRADIVTARAATAHAAWAGRTRVTREDIRAAARLALPHRRRRNPFDAPGLDEDLLDRLLGEDDQPPPDRPEGEDADGEEPDADAREHNDDQRRPDEDSEASTPEAAADQRSTPSTNVDEQPPDPDRHQPESDDADDRHGPDGTDPDQEHGDHPQAPAGTAPHGVSGAADPFRVRLFTARGIGQGAAGRRSRALTERGRTTGARPRADGPIHLPATIRAAAPHQGARGRADRLLFTAGDLRRATTEGREANLLLFCVDASGSMAARRRMESVKTAILSLLLDAYQRRDRIGLVAFRAADADLVLPPTSSVDAAARRLTELPHGGRTPLAEGLWRAAETLRLERIRDPRRRPLLVVITDGRATAGPEALPRAYAMAERLRDARIPALVIDCETGRFRMGLAADLAARLGAQHVALAGVGADAILGAVAGARTPGEAA